ncbi:unnamed protein product [Arabis nemorensis]|uniref:Uncharacterized protein n=1 Tax=Arabis nemorensis TaxID=586526 RepID=A0A565BHU3_9BRAS|nr:unnamed protein product [Arabis nemorensis]
MEHWKKAKDKKGPKMARIDDAFGHLVVMREMALRPAKPDPNRPKIDESELGCATIWIYVHSAVVIRNRGDFELENRSGGRSLVSKQKISGKTGVLKDNKSLAWRNANNVFGMDARKIMLCKGCLNWWPKTSLLCDKAPENE